VDASIVHEAVFMLAIVFAFLCLFFMGILSTPPMAGELPREYLDGLLDTINILLASKSREVRAVSGYPLNSTNEGAAAEYPAGNFSWLAISR
jgi:hypothetical protein